ncbi:hypothetical protein [Thalassolituus sp. C2-1]|uniref:hypothetical protein n=1 Tax=Venatorbacter sp. C2-1 TaxID=2597518 RepID=UPI001197AF5E|nr:hypothetical protein [Thalassolituus sp. C2-1]TVV42632.1 hypothetical protein FOT50_14230 [Thalassolituus sp. C2-1]
MNMNKTLLALTVFITSIASTNTFAALPMSHVEVQLLNSSVLSIAPNNISARLCDGCEIEQVKITSNTRFQEKNSVVDFQTALELFLKRKYEYLSLGINRNDRSADYIIIGGFDELAADPNNPENQSQVEK